MMKIALIIFVVLTVSGVLAFVAMGFRSRGGSAPGMRAMALQSCGSRPNCVWSGASPNNTQHVAGFAFDAGEEDGAWTGLIEAIRTAGGKLEQNSPPYLNATFSSKVFGFVDDFECLIDRDTGVIHVRSSARVGYNDRNVNRARVEQIRAMLNKR